ncbi:MAG: FprA family A-type flavoprotein [Candidatus Aminicenantes bacterium]|nr:FprA family A-type flavoprotein [Candidatus Aminicenantes bacterium]
MHPRPIKDNVFAVGAVDWDRRLFDALIPLPDGTSYNAYLVKGSEKTALLDTVDPSKTEILFENLRGVERLDYVVAHHAEQDHSGNLPAVLARYPMAQVVCSAKAKGMLIDHLHLAESKIMAVEDGATLSLGDVTLEFAYTPWVHWPETMSTFAREPRVLFSCDFFGSHLAQSDLFVKDETYVYEAAKRYFAEIMLPFRSNIRRNMERIKDFPAEVVAPSHGPVYPRPAFILDAYRDWAGETPKNEAVIPFVTMHGSTQLLVDRLVGALADRGVAACPFNVAEGDIGKLAIALVDAATIVIGSPTVHVGPHPKVAYAALLANALRPKAKFAAVVGSFGWATKMPGQVLGLLPNLKLEVLPGVVVKGMPRAEDLLAVDELAETIARKHRELGLA